MSEERDAGTHVFLLKQIARQMRNWNWNDDANRVSDAAEFIHTLTAERDAARAEVERLRAAVTAYRHVFTVMSAQGETDPWYEMALIDGTLEGDMQALRKASLLFPALDPSIAVQAALRGLERGDGE